MDSCPSVSVDREDPLVDQIIQIQVTGLQAKQTITVRAEVDEKGHKYAGSGCFIADDSGCVDLTKHASTAGTYTGVAAMGLFWSMKPSPQEPFGMRLIKSNASYPLMVDLTVYKGHMDFETLYIIQPIPICSKQMRRWYMANDVQKIIIRSGRLRGTLFLPPGRGPFPGVIDMFGVVGSCIEFRAALLASHGFATMALPYFLYDDLPQSMADLELEYFLEATEWLCSHPAVISDNIGVVGVSKGGEFGMQMAYYCDKIKAVVSINGAPFLSTTPISYKGEVIGQSEVLPDRALETDEGLVLKYGIECDPKNYLPIWEKDVHILLINGSDDHIIQPVVFDNLAALYPVHRKHLFTFVRYKDAGHLLEPPYAPHARVTMKFTRGVGSVNSGTLCLVWGGHTEAHAHAQEDAWKKTIGFLRKHLPNDTSTASNGRQTHSNL